MKKSIVLLVMLALLAAVCNAFAADQEITILLETVPDTNYIREVVPQFEAETGIKVNIEEITYVGMHEKLISQLVGAAHSGSYDVIVVDKNWTGEFIGADWVLPLDEFIERDGFDTSVYIPSLFAQLGYYNGVTYMLPFYNYTMGLFYRTDLINDPEEQAAYKAKYGTDLKVPETIDEMIQVAEFFTRDEDGDGEKDMYGVVQQLARGVGIHAEWANILFGLDGWYYDDDWNARVNDAAGVKALESMITLYKNSGPAGSTAYNFDEQSAMFSSGKAAMMYSYTTQYAPFAATEVAGKFDMAVAPGGHGVNGGWGWAIPRTAPDYELSWKFLKWVESYEIAHQRAALGGSPTQIPVFEAEDLREKYPFYDVELDMIATGQPIPIFAGSAAMIDVLATELSEATADGKDPQAALDAAAAQMNELVKNDPLTGK